MRTMHDFFRTTALLLLPALIGIGCGDQEPGQNDAGAGGDGGPGDTDDYYPLAVGDSWTYEEIEQGAAAVTLLYEITEETTKTFEHGLGEREVFAMQNTSPGTSTERRVQYIEDDGVRAVRLSHDVFDDTGALTKRRDYVPGFLRFDRGRLEPGATWTEEVVEYSDSMDGSDVTQVTARYRYEIAGSAEPVTVEAGTFSCLHVRRIAITDGEVKDYYWARGVGKVREITSGSPGKTEDLVAFTIVDR